VHRPVTTEISPDLEIAAAAALAGGSAACAYYGSDDLDVRDKSAGSHVVAAAGTAEDPVTLAEHAANDAILDFLRTHTTEPVISEESRPPDRVSDAERLWIVDPLDGTKEFIARNGEFSVMVGLAETGAARLGAVYQPAVGRLYLGDVARGAWLVQDPGTPSESRVRLRISRAHSPPLRLIRSRSHPDPALEELESRLAPLEVVISGSVGIKCARIACGEADLYVHPVPFLKEWDTCAPEAVLRGAGGVVTDCAGGPLRYGKLRPLQPRGIFCGQREIHERVAQIVREVARHLTEV
jgi:3'(2'), 5'-bisphosphate nucleotidase